MQPSPGSILCMLDILFEGQIHTRIVLTRLFTCHRFVIQLRGYLALSCWIFTFFFFFKILSIFSFPQLAQSISTSLTDDCIHTPDSNCNMPCGILVLSFTKVSQDGKIRFSAFYVTDISLHFY